MSDISKVTVEAFEGGYIVAPESEMKKVVIPSPPTIKMMPINPRDAVIYLTEQAVTPESANIDAIKAYAEDNKVVLFCLSDKTEQAVVSAYQYAISNAKTINIKKDAFSVKADEASMEAANAAVEALRDEDAEVEDAEVLAI